MQIFLMIKRYKMNNKWLIALIVFIVVVILTLLIVRNKKDKENLLNKFTKAGEEGKIDSNTVIN